MAEDQTLPIELLPDETELVNDDLTDFDVLFPIIPAEDDPYPPDDGGDSTLVDDLVEQALEEDTQDEELEAIDDASEFAFDWGAREFFVSGAAGEPLRVTGDAAIVEWVLKALNTEKGVYAIYSDEYGSDLPKVIGLSLAEPVLYAEIARAIRECVSFHPRIGAVQIEEIRFDPGYTDALFVSFSFYLDGESDPVTMEVTA